MRISATLTRGNVSGPFDAYYRGSIQRMERAALVATDRARRMGLTSIRSAMQGAGLGRLGNGLSSTSDLSEGRGVHRTGADSFSASGTIFIRSGSRRTRGAIESYTRGAQIVPRRGRWLWITSKELPRVTGRYRMTPELYVKGGFEQKVGPLVRIRGSNGYPLLIVRNVGVSAAGKERSARSLTKRGMPRRGQIAQDMIVAFIGIPSTSRAARVDVHALLRSVQAELPRLFAQAMERV